MKQAIWRLSVFMWIALCVCSTASYSQNQMSIGSGTGLDGMVMLTLDSEDPVEGFVSAVKIGSPDVLQVTDIVKTDALAAAEGEYKNIYENGFTYSIVMDVEEPFEGQTLPVGSTEVAEIHVSAVGSSEEQVVAIDLVDGEMGNPVLDNIIVISGQSYGQSEGLTLSGGTWTVEARTDKLIVDAVNVPQGQTTGTVGVMAEHNKPLEGFVLSLGHEAGISLEAVALSAASEAVGVEFEHAELYAEGGTYGVVLDFEAPFNGQTIPVTEAPSHIADFTYSLQADLAPEEVRTFGLMLLDDVFGTPRLQNLFVEDGLSVFPEFQNGSITFIGEEEAPPSDIVFSINEDGTTIGVGGCAEVGFYYTSEQDPIQGVSIAATYDPRLTVGDLNLTGSITAAVHAEFVNHHAADGELIIGILVDSTPPVSVDRMFPPTDVPTLIARVELCDEAQQLTCGECLPINFENGITGAGSVAINNRAAVFNQSVAPRLEHGELCVVSAPKFKRGDCNYDQMVDIADPAAMLSYVFLGVFDPPCLDACDGNDDGVVDLADSVMVLRFLFKFGEEPPAPGPYTAGLDPTEDIYGMDLGCEAADDCK